MKPAYHIPLGAEKLKLIGEICAIQGQIEWAMQNTVRDRLKVDNPLAQRIMGSTSIATNAEIWICVVRRVEKRKGVLAQAERAYSDIRELTEGRNDFVHAVYFSKTKNNPTGIYVRVATPGGPLPDYRNAVAVRVRNKKQAPIGKLVEIRDIAAAISIRVAHVHHMAVIRRAYPDYPSPWQNRLGELPPLDPPTQAARPAKAPKSQPRP